MEKLQALKDQMEETSLLEETAEDEAEKVLKAKVWNEKKNNSFWAFS